MLSGFLRRPGATLLVVGGLLGALLVASLVSGDRLQAAGFTDPGAQSMKARERLDGKLGYDPSPGMVILARSPAGFRTSVAREALGRLVARVTAERGVGHVDTAFGAGALPVLLSPDAHQTLVLVHFRSISQDDVAAPIQRLRAVREAGLGLAFGGYALGVIDLNRIARGDLVRAELIAFPLLALLVLLTFRGLVAAAMPVVIGGASVLGTLACLRLLSNVVGISIFALNLAVLLGLGLAVDYGLFLVSRYREEASERGWGLPAVRTTLATAGRAVALSGCAVAGASASLLLFPQEFIYSMGLAGMFVALFSALAALVITPPLLLLSGGRIGIRASGRRARASDRRWWYRWPRWVMRRHVEVALVSVFLLIAAAAPALGLHATFADLSSVPEGFQTRTVADIVSRDFTRNLEYPVNVAIDLRAGPAPATLAADRLAALLTLTPGVALVSPVRLASRDTALIQIVLAQPPLSPPSELVIAQLRMRSARLLVGGATAEFSDLKRSIAQRAPLVLALAALATVLVLFLLTGSLVLPLKALLFHALDLGAVFGLLVLIFQDHLFGIGDLIGYRGPLGIETTVSVVIIASTLGLATDYSILLLARITEEHRSGRSDEQAVAIGIERTGPVITRAALLLAVALLALTSSRVFLVKQLTVGQVLGVLIDVTFVRMLLLPSFMRLLGPANWWAPAPLKRAYARLSGSATGSARTPLGPPS